VEKVEAEPTTFVLVLRLIGELGDREGLADVFGLDEAGIGCDATDGAHAKYDSFALGDQRPEEIRLGGPMRIPVAVQRAEPCGGQGLVDGRVVPDPGIPCRDAARVGSQAVGEGWVEKAGIRGAASVVHQADNGAYAKLL
jgi:hypothetical protein